MYNLHDSIILEIFSFLNIYEKLRCSLVCRRWRRLVNDWKLWQRIDVNSESNLSNFVHDDRVGDWALAWGAHILELHLDDCHWLTDQAVCTIGDFCPRLQTLSLKGCAKIGNPGVIYLSKFCHRLRHVDFYHTRVTALGFRFLVERNAGLEILRLPNQGNCKRMLNAVYEHCDHVTEIAMQDSIDEDRLLLDDDTFRRFAERFPMLRKVDLTWCCHITDKALDYIAQNCSGLRCLHIKECPMISDEGIRAIAKRCPLLGDLHLERQTLVNNACCYAIRDHLYYMTSLGLIDTCITDLGIEVITTNAGNLRVLRIGENCFRPQNIKGVCLNSIARRCNRLEKLHVFSVKMDDTSLVTLCQNLGQLRELHLGACGQVSRTGIRELTEKCGKLTELRLYGCPSFRDCHLDVMATKMTELRRLEVFDCDKITQDGASKFGEKRPDCLLNI